MEIGNPVKPDTEPVDTPVPAKESTDAPKRRGRPPGSKNGTGTRTSADVTAAMGVMESLYGFVIMGALALGKGEQALELQAKIPDLQESNKRFFVADRKLAARIAKLGKVGTLGFYVSNVMAIAPVVMAFVPEGYHPVNLFGTLFGSREEVTEENADDSARNL